MAARGAQPLSPHARFADRNAVRPPPRRHGGHRSSQGRTASDQCRASSKVGQGVETAELRGVLGRRRDWPQRSVRRGDLARAQTQKGHGQPREPGRAKTKEGPRTVGQR